MNRSKYISGVKAKRPQPLWGEVYAGQRYKSKHEGGYPKKDVITIKSYHPPSHNNIIVGHFRSTSGVCHEARGFLENWELIDGQD